MVHNFDTIVIGGGLMGCSIAFQLASKGVKTAVVERNAHPGMETTARSGAIIRAHYGVPELVSLAAAANQRFRRFTDEVGDDCGFVQCGYSVIVDEADVQTLKSNVAMQKGIGAKVAFLDRSQMSALAPNLIVDDIALAAYEPEGGYASPAKTVNAYAKKAAQLGAVFLYGKSVIGAEEVAGGWSLDLNDGAYLSCANVVLATGNWSPRVGSFFGLNLPVTPVRAQIVVVDRPTGTESMPVVSDLINLAYFREEADGGMWVGSSDTSDLQERLPYPENFNETVDDAPIMSALAKTSQRFRSDGKAYSGDVKRSFAGLYETTPDWQPVIDSFSNNLHVAVGFSGHGFKLAPVIGDIVAAAVVGETLPFDTTLFSLDRFANDRPIKSHNAYRRARFLR